MKKDNCIFCKIAAGEIPSHTLYEDDDFKVIFDLGPATKGHALIIPKEHADNLFELDDEVVAKVLVLAKKIATKMKDAFKCDGLNIVQNNGECAGQSVNHFHMHIIPRYEGDNALPLWKPGSTDDETLAELEKIFKA
ncbi:histidine triad (HIT) family protein [Lachnospiraceae bacterium RM5]|nr:histidine triad (HIT) family protein [Lachnospiraceae bacterium RM5]